MTAQAIDGNYVVYTQERLVYKLMVLTAIKSKYIKSEKYVQLETSRTYKVVIID